MILRLGGHHGTSPISRRINRHLSRRSCRQRRRPGACTTPRREFYQLRRYNLMSGPQLKLTEDYLGDALIPALGRMGMGPVGAFKLDIGQDTPPITSSFPAPRSPPLPNSICISPRTTTSSKLAAPFWNATATAPAYQRVEISLLAAFEGWPKITPPASSATKGKRIFQLRTYESPSNGDHVRKVEMFHSGEFDIFLESRLPSRLLRRRALRLPPPQPHLHAQL